MALLDLRFHPFGEEVLEHGGAHVRDPLLGRLREFELGLRQVIINMRMVFHEKLTDLFDAETLISLN